MTTAATDTTTITISFLLESFMHEPERQSLGFPSTLQEKVLFKASIHKGTVLRTEEYQKEFGKFLTVTLIPFFEELEECDHKDRSRLNFY